MSSSNTSGIFNQPFGITWRKALLSAPRLVPDSVMYYTSPEGPHPLVVTLPSRGQHKIPVYIFIPPAPSKPKQTRAEKKAEKADKAARPKATRTSTSASLRGAFTREKTSQVDLSRVTTAPSTLSPTSASFEHNSEVSSPSLSQTTTVSSVASTPTTPTPRAKVPVILDFHGGGFIFGSCQEQAPFCSLLSRSLSALVISVDYRLGPASQFPAAVEDAEDVLQAILDPSCAAYTKLRAKINKELKSKGREGIELDEEKLAASGFSSGGNLALNLALSIPRSRAADRKPELKHPWPSPLPAVFADGQRKIPLLLFFPSFDARQLPSERPLPPGMEKAKGFFANLNLEAELMPTYLPRDQALHPRASPGLAQIKQGSVDGSEGERVGLHPQASILLILPELDSLSEQSLAWVKKVKTEGRAEDLLIENVKGCVHGWTQFPDSWLLPDGKVLKYEMFERARAFVEKAWRE